MISEKANRFMIFKFYSKSTRPYPLSKTSRLTISGEVKVLYARVLCRVGSKEVV